MSSLSRRPLTAPAPANFTIDPPALSSALALAAVAPAAAVFVRPCS